MNSQPPPASSSDDAEKNPALPLSGSTTKSPAIEWQHPEATERLRLYFSEQAWIESSAIEQLNRCLTFEGMKYVVGLPDLHAGKGSAVGAAYVTEGVIYPYLIGNDIGCGMGLWRTGLQAKKAKLDRWKDKLADVGEPFEWDFSESYLERHGLEAYPHGLGTIGGGNHFAELQQIDSVMNEAALAELGLDAKELVVLIHSGSRGHGGNVLNQMIEIYRDGPVAADSDDAKTYLTGHDEAVKWAGVNRDVVAQRFCQALGGESQPVLDNVHNFLEWVEDEGWIHRKGAATATDGPFVIPGSRGSMSYLVQAVGDQQHNAYSLAHGAGRKWMRHQCKGRLREKYKADELRRTSLGSRVICGDKELLYEEAPEAYKDIESVIEDLTNFGLIEVIASLKPLITYKNKEKGPRNKERVY